MHMFWKPEFHKLQPTVTALNANLYYRRNYKLLKRGRIYFLLLTIKILKKSLDSFILQRFWFKFIRSVTGFLPEFAKHRWKGLVTDTDSNSRPGHAAWHWKSNSYQRNFFLISRIYLPLWSTSVGQHSLTLMKHIVSFILLWFMVNNLYKTGVRVRVSTIGDSTMSGNKIFCFCHTFKFN